MFIKRILFGVVCGVCSLAAQAQSRSLYDPANFQPLTSDMRQRHPGDLITVLVVENATATSTANTSASRDADIGFDLRGPGKSFAGGARTGNQLDGRGRTERQGRLVAQITVAIRAINPQGDLVVAGEQLLEINNEKQQIRVEGRIRPQDVSDANVVMSTRIADARISYAGQGDLADSQRPAWWQRFLTWFGV